MSPMISRWFVCLTFLTGPLLAEKPEHRALAEYYAPVIYQESKSAVLDSIARFDYDGDWNGANNWQNAYLFPLKGYVYYAVVESTQHYFVNYAFFHPRDFTARPLEGFAPKTEHENDMEGCMLVVERDRTRFGRPVLLETLAHDHFYKYDNPHYRRVSAIQRAKPKTKRSWLSAPVPATAVDGSIVFLKQEDDTHHSQPAIYIEPEGHGVKAATAEVRDANFKFPGMIYRFSGRGAEIPKGNNDPDVSYELIGMEDSLWARRSEIGESSTYCCADRYSRPDGSTALIGSAFNGPIGGCAAKPPWGWDQADDGPIEKGDLFRDPLSAIPKQLQLAGLQGTYLHNPYLPLDPVVQAKEGTLCSESAVSKTIGQSVATSLLGISKTLFSGGFNQQQVGDRAKQLFLNGAVLLEWWRLADFQNWSWNKGLAESLVPKLLTENARDQIQLPIVQALGFSSPVLQAPARYFHSLVLNYNCSREGISARAYWMVEGMTEFDEAHSVVTPLRKSDDWISDRIDFLKSPQWDTSKTVTQIRLDIVGPNQEKLASVDPTKPDATTQSSLGFLVINSIVLDRYAFSDTFER